MSSIPGVTVSFAGKPEIVVFSVVDRIPPECISLAEDAFNQLVQRGHKFFVLDLSEARYIGSNGVGIVAYYRTILGQRGGKIVVVKAPPSVMAKIAPFIKGVLQVVDSREEAIALLQTSEYSAAQA